MSSATCCATIEKTEGRFKGMPRNFDKPARSKLESVKLMLLDAAVERSQADIQAGRTLPIEDVVARLTAKYAAMAQDAAGTKMSD
jgi:hypothetical protein